MAHIALEDRRRQLIDAASRVIRRDGIAGASTRAIAKEAGVPLASLHYAFHGKDELLSELLRWAVQGTEEIFDEGRLAPGCGVQVAVRYFLEGFWKLDETFIFAEFEILLWSRKTESTVNEAPTLYARIEELVEAAYRRAAKPDEQKYDFKRLARLSILLSDGIQFGLVCVGRSYVAAEDLEQFSGDLVSLVKPR